MWIYEKKLQYPVKIKNPNPKLAQIIISQLGGPDGELAASMRYLHQRYAMPYKQVVGILTDVGTEASDASTPSPSNADKKPSHSRSSDPARRLLYVVKAQPLPLYLLKSEILEGEEILSLTAEHEAETVGAVGVG